MAPLDELPHLAVEEGQQQRPDVRPVDIGVGHDDDLVVAHLEGVELVLADPGAETLDEGPDLLRGQHPVEARLLDVEDLAPQRQDRLESPIAALFGRTAGRIALDDEDLGELRVALRTVGELARQGRGLEGAFAPGELARLARRLAGPRRIEALGDDPSSPPPGSPRRRSRAGC